MTSSSLAAFILHYVLQDDRIEVYVSSLVYCIVMCVTLANI